MAWCVRWCNWLVRGKPAPAHAAPPGRRLGGGGTTSAARTLPVPAHHQLLDGGAGLELAPLSRRLQWRWCRLGHICGHGPHCLAARPQLPLRLCPSENQLCWTTNTPPCQLLLHRRQLHCDCSARAQQHATHAPARSAGELDSVLEDN